MAGWFKPKQKSDEVGEVAQAVYQDQEQPVAVPASCGNCYGPLEEGEFNLCFRCYTKKSDVKPYWWLRNRIDVI
jgi:hypothetical protein